MISHPVSVQINKRMIAMSDSMKFDGTKNSSQAVDVSVNALSTLKLVLNL